VKPARPYADPYFAGVALGLVLLASFVLTGRGLGASGAFAATAAGLTNAVAPARAAASPLWSRYLAGGGPWREWLLFELAGVIIGGFLSALIAGRLRGTIERGSRISPRARIAYAFGGGALMGFGAILARGCTSGLALTGGALLAVGSWIFIAAAFAAAYLFAPLVRKAWR
jgi:uncharacterized membrane protein YedE/YeeE